MEATAPPPPSLFPPRPNYHSEQIWHAQLGRLNVSDNSASNVLWSTANSLPFALNKACCVAHYTVLFRHPISGRPPKVAEHLGRIVVNIARSLLLKSNIRSAFYALALAFATNLHPKSSSSITPSYSTVLPDSTSAPHKRNIFSKPRKRQPVDPASTHAHSSCNSPECRCSAYSSISSRQSSTFSAAYLIPLPRAFACPDRYRRRLK
jgi:hypothetical protein